MIIHVKKDRKNTKVFSIFCIYIYIRGTKVVPQWNTRQSFTPLYMTKDQTIMFAIDKLMDKGFITMTTNPLTNYMRAQLSDLYDMIYDRYGRVSATDLAENLVIYHARQMVNRTKADRRAARNERRNYYTR